MHKGNGFIRVMETGLGRWNDFRTIRVRLCHNSDMNRKSKPTGKIVFKMLARVVIVVFCVVLVKKYASLKILPRSLDSRIFSIIKERVISEGNIDVLLSVTRHYSHEYVEQMRRSYCDNEDIECLNDWTPPTEEELSGYIEIGGPSSEWQYWLVNELREFLISGNYKYHHYNERKESGEMVIYFHSQRDENLMIAFIVTKTDDGDQIIDSILYGDTELMEINEKENDG